MKTYAKAITSGVIALLGSLAVAAADNAITLGEGLAAAATAAAAFGAVYGIRNTDTSAPAP